MPLGTIENGESGLSCRTKINESFAFIDNIDTQLQIERLYDGTSALTAQNPPALDTDMSIQFGAVFGTGADPVQTIAQGGDTEASILQINEAGTYRIKVQAAVGRLGSSQTSILNLRALLNGTQAGRTVQLKFDDSNITFDFIDEAWLTLPAGIQIAYQMSRDPSGNNSGGLLAGTVGSTGWNPAASAALRVERFVSVTP